MSMGAERVEAPPQGDSEWTKRDRGGAVRRRRIPDIARSRSERGAALRRRTGCSRSCLFLLALGWLGVSGYALSLAWPGPSFIAWTGWAATFSAPLILLALAWLIFGRSTRRETERFTRAVAAMRRESQALESVLAIVAGAAQENRAVLQRGGGAADVARRRGVRPARPGHLLSLARDAELDRKAQALDAAAASARVDIGVLLSDLPRAEEQARAVAEAMKEAGLSAHGQAGALEGQLAALTARGREADETVGGAAQRLGAHVARIESSTGAAAERIDEAAAQMNAAVDGAMAPRRRSGRAARAGLEAQGQTMLAMIEQSRAAFEQAGEDAGQRPVGTARAGRRQDRRPGRPARRAGRGQPRAGRRPRPRELMELDARIGALGRSGDEQGARLSQSIAGLREVTGALQRELDQGQACHRRADRPIARR